MKNFENASITFDNIIYTLLEKLSYIPYHLCTLLRSFGCY